MPNTFCAGPGCPEIVSGRARYCPEHAHILTAKKRRRTFDPDFYGRAEWKRLRAEYRKRHPLCERCRRAAAAHVHHKIPRRERPELSLSWSNLEALCARCHGKEHGAGIR